MFNISFLRKEESMILQESLFKVFSKLFTASSKNFEKNIPA